MVIDLKEVLVPSSSTKTHLLSELQTEHKHFWHVRKSTFLPIFRKCPLINVKDCSLQKF